MAERLNKNLYAKNVLQHIVLMDMHGWRGAHARQLIIQHMHWFVTVSVRTAHTGCTHVYMTRFHKDCGKTINSTINLCSGLKICLHKNSPVFWGIFYSAAMPHTYHQPRSAFVLLKLMLDVSFGRMDPTVHAPEVL